MRHAAIPLAAADAAATPYTYFVPGWASFTARVVENFNLRAYYLEEVLTSRESALDYYVFMRNAYLQNRRRKVMDTA